MGVKIKMTRCCDTKDLKKLRLDEKSLAKVRIRRRFSLSGYNAWEFWKRAKKWWILKNHFVIKFFLSLVFIKKYLLAMKNILTLPFESLWAKYWVRVKLSTFYEQIFEHQETINSLALFGMNSVCARPF